MSDPDRSQPCDAARADGEPCRGFALPGDAYCWSHSPSVAAERAEARRRGGYNSKASARAVAGAPAQLQGVLDGLVTTFDQTMRGECDPSTARAVASVARAVTAVYDCAVVTERVERVEDRLDDLAALGNGKAALR